MTTAVERQANAAKVMVDWYPKSAHGFYCPEHFATPDERSRPDGCDCFLKTRAKGLAAALDEAGLLCALRRYRDTP